MEKTNPTPNPLDVLALAHRAVAGVCPDCGRDYSDDALPDKCASDCPAEEARAAVAELIEAARGALRNKPFARSHVGQRLSAALAIFSETTR